MYSTFYRSYDPTIGRFQGVDPLADKYAGFSPYSFAFNDPVNFNDPTGAEPPFLSEGTWSLIRDLYQNTAQDGSSYWSQEQSATFNDPFTTMGLVQAGAYNDFGAGGAKFNGGGGIAQYGSFSDSHGKVGAHMVIANDLNVSVTGISSKIQSFFEQKSEYDENLTFQHSYSDKLRTWSGRIQGVSSLFEQAFKRGSLYSPATAGRMTTVIIDKSFKALDMSVRLYRPLFQISAVRAGQLGTALKVAGKSAALAGIVFASYDMSRNGVTTSNTLDLTMSALALSGFGTGIASAYFISNAVLKYTTGKDIGQHVDSVVNDFEDIARTRLYADND